MSKKIILLIVSFLLTHSLAYAKEYEDLCLLENNKIPDNALIIDVRTKKEYLLSHAPHSINIPLYYEKDGTRVLNKNFIDQINALTDDDYEKKLVLLCRIGIRSAKAAQMLSKEGYDNLINIKKGFANGWRKAKLPVEK